MTDFVDRLLGRAETPPVRPIVPSLFEPAPVVGAKPPLPMGEVTVSGPAAPDPPVTGPARDTAPAPESPRRSRAEPGPPEDHTPRVSAEPDTEPDTGAPPPASPAWYVPVDPAPASPVAVGTERIAGRVPAPPTRAEPVPAPSPRSRTGRSSPVPRQASAGPQETVSHDPPARTHPVQPATGPLPPARSPETGVRVVTRREPASEPSVHISIGRVEVRAAVAATPPKRVARNEQRVQSLDEYLRERAAGEPG